MSKIKVVVGVDIGGTNNKFGFVDKKGNCYYEKSIPTRAEEKSEQLFKRLFLEINQAYKQFENNLELTGIGIGARNANYYKGTVEQPPNLNW